MLRKLLIYTFLLFIFTSSRAQQNVDYELFMKNANELSNLYRGSLPYTYRFIYTGTFYAYDKEFKPGEVIFNNKLYTNLQLNLNSHIDELILYIEESERYVTLNKDFVESFSMGERKFINVREGDREEALSMEKGYYEVLFSNSSSINLLKSVRKQYEEVINDYVSVTTNSKLERLFTPIFKYYLVDENRVKQIRRVRDITKFFSVRKRGIRRFIRRNDLDVRREKDEAYTQIMKFIEPTSISIER